MSTEIIAAGATVLMAIVAVVTTIINYFILRSQVDPKVIVYLTADTGRPTLILLVIENTGRGVARDVRFETSRPLRTHAWGLANSKTTVGEEMTEGPICNGIPSLGPGSRRVITWGQYGGLSEVLGEEAIRITVRYWSERAGIFSPREEEEDFILEVESFALTDASRPPVVRIADAIESVSKEIGQVITHSTDLNVTVRGGKLSVDVGNMEQDVADKA